MKRLIIIFIVLALPGGTVFSQKKETYRVRTVVIDPGHGGAKPGAQGSRSQEKTITLAVAKKFGKLIQDNYPDVKVIFTRTTDVDISLAERARIANRNKADLFISIHANSHPTAAPNGVETFVMGLSESRANLEVAKKENADILLEADYKDNADYNVFDPNSPESYVLLAMFQNSYLDKSLNLAQAIQKQYMRNFKAIDRGVKQAELFVLYKTAMPSVLTEIGFISNPTEEAFMLSDEGQAKIAVSLFNAFMIFKATEEGSNKIANPKIDLPGYKAAGQEKPSGQEQAKEEATVVAAEPVQPAEEKPAVEPEAKAAEPGPVQPEVAQNDHGQAAPQPEPAPAQPAPTPVPTEPAKPQAKPTPTVELPQQAPPAVREEPQPEPAPEVQPMPQAPRKEPLAAPHNTVQAEDDAHYTVQFLFSPDLYQAGDPHLGGVSEFRTIKQAKGYAYCTGRFATRQEAVDYCAHIRRAAGFKDAWVLHDKKAQADEKADKSAVAKSENAKPAQSQQAVKGLTYRVQFCSASRILKPGDPDLHGIKDIHYAENGKYYVYSAGDYATEKEARQRCSKIRSTTKFKDAFVIAIYNGERITLEKAAAIKKKK